MPTDRHREIAEQIAAPTRGRIEPALYDEIVAAITIMLGAEAKAQRERDAEIANNARLEGGVDLRELVSRIRNGDAFTDRPDFRSRAIALCKEKEAAYSKRAADSMEHERLRYSAKAQAARQLARELENL